MKLVIATQYEENYGAHDWDGVGECPQYWKMKGGSTFVVENLTAEQAERARASGCPTLRGLIDCGDQVAKEYVVSVYVVANDVEVCEPWDTVTKLTYVGGQWIAREFTDNGEYGYMRREIASKTATWTLLPNGERGDFRVEYTLRDGSVVDHKGLEKALA
jgi:hypothetical protein